MLGGVGIPGTLLSIQKQAEKLIARHGGESCLHDQTAELDLEVRVGAPLVTPRGHELSFQLSQAPDQSLPRRRSRPSRS